MKNIFLLALLAVFAGGCKKVPGEGGNSSISGNVLTEYRLVLSNPATEQYTTPAADEDVYIVYGDHTSPDDRIQTNYDGDFEFRNLRPGDYTIYVYSKDTTGQTQVDENRMPIILDVEISDKKQELVVDDVTIYDEI